MPTIIVIAKGVSATHPNGKLFYTRNPEIDFSSNPVELEANPEILDAYLEGRASSIALPSQGCRVGIDVGEEVRYFDLLSASIEGHCLKLGDVAGLSEFREYFSALLVDQEQEAEDSDDTATTEPSSPNSILYASGLFARRQAFPILPLAVDEDGQAVPPLVRSNAGL